MKFELLNRFTGKVQVTAEIECDKDTPNSVKIGLAAEWACKAGISLERAYLKGANLKGADLKGADLKGADLEGAYLVGANLKGADLEGANLEGAYLKGADLEGAYLVGAKLVGAYLKGAYLKGAYLRGANLEGANLKGADLKGANLEVPVIENIHQKVYAAASQENALDMGRWHTCETTHCRAGWVTTLAGEAGAKLESQTSTATAAHLIYRKSDPNMNCPIDFYDSNENALAEMKRLAKKEASCN